MDWPGMDFNHDGKVGMGESALTHALIEDLEETDRNLERAGSSGRHSRTTRQSGDLPHLEDADKAFLGLFLVIASLVVIPFMILIFTL